MSVKIITAVVVVVAIAAIGFMEAGGSTAIAENQLKTQLETLKTENYLSSYGQITCNKSLLSTKVDCSVKKLTTPDGINIKKMTLTNVLDAVKINEIYDNNFSSLKQNETLSNTLLLEDVQLQENSPLWNENIKEKLTALNDKALMQKIEKGLKSPLDITIEHTLSKDSNNSIMLRANAKADNTIGTVDIKTAINSKDTISSASSAQNSQQAMQNITVEDLVLFVDLKENFIPELLYTEYKAEKTQHPEKVTEANLTQQQFISELKQKADASIDEEIALAKQQKQDDQIPLLKTLKSKIKTLLEGKQESVEIAVENRQKLPLAQLAMMAIMLQGQPEEAVNYLGITIK